MIENLRYILDLLPLNVAIPPSTKFVITRKILVIPALTPITKLSVFLADTQYQAPSTPQTYHPRYEENLEYTKHNLKLYKYKLTVGLV